MAITQKILVSITKSVDGMPLQMRELAGLLRIKCEEKFPDTRYTSVGGYIFLRYFCPSLISPENYGLSSKKLDASSRRMFILIAKILQNLANDVEFGAKERHMSQLNELITQNKEKIRQYFDEVAKPIGSSYGGGSSSVEEKTESSLSEQQTATSSTSGYAEAVPMPKDLKTRSLACLYSFIESNREDIEAALSDNPRLKMNFINFMEEEPFEWEMETLVLKTKKSSKQIHLN